MFFVLVSIFWDWQVYLFERLYWQVYHLIRVGFLGILFGMEGLKLPPTTCHQLVRVMSETWNFLWKYTHRFSSENIPFITKTSLILLMSEYFCKTFFFLLHSSKQKNSWWKWSKIWSFRSIDLELFRPLKHQCWAISRANSCKSTGMGTQKNVPKNKK